jgi:hypothetical protein
MALDRVEVQFLIGGRDQINSNNFFFQITKNVLNTVSYIDSILLFTQTQK